jgi:hypothetical protein
MSLPRDSLIQCKRCKRFYETTSTRSLGDLATKEAATAARLMDMHNEYYVVACPLCYNEDIPAEAVI